MTQHPDEPRVDARLRALEEGQGFVERLAEQLAEEVRTLGRRVTELAQHVARLEARLFKSETEERDGPPDPNAPK